VQRLEILIYYAIKVSIPWSILNTGQGGFEGRFPLLKIVQVLQPTARFWAESDDVLAFTTEASRLLDLHLRWRACAHDIARC